jgi:hypothetical protein
MAVQTVVAKAPSTLAYHEGQPLLVNADQAAQKTVQQFLLQQSINGFITGSIATGLPVILGTTAYVLHQGMTGADIFLPTIFSAVFGGGITGAVSRVTYRMLQNTTTTWGGRGVLGLIGGALWGASAGTGIALFVLGSPFAAGSSTGLFLTPILSLGAGGSLILGGVSALTANYGSAASLGLAAGSILGLGIGGGLGAAVQIGGLGAIVGSLITGSGIGAIYANCNCCFGCKGCEFLREVDPPAKKQGP